MEYEHQYFIKASGGVLKNQCNIKVTNYVNIQPNFQKFNWIVIRTIGC